MGTRSDHDDSSEPLAAMILGTYREIPGLALQLNQAARFFGIETARCRTVMDDLVTSGDVDRREDGRYVRRQASR